MGRPRKKNKHLPPCVFEQHGAYYHVVKGVWNPLGQDLLAALAEYALRISDQKEGGLSPLIDAALERMKKRKIDPLKPATVAQYTIAAHKLKHLMRKISTPAAVKQRDAAQVKLLLAPTPNMCNRVLSFARQVFADFVEQQVIDSNPFIGIRRHKEAKRTRNYSPAEWTAIYAKAGPRLQVIMDGLYLTDRRIGDVLKIHQADLTRHPEGIYFKEQKTGKELILRWTPDLRAWVERAKSLGGNVRALTLLHNRRGKAPDYRTVADQWRAACAAAGVADAHLHDIRAMSATDVKRQRGKAAAQAVLNHTEEATTNIYLRGTEIPIVDGPAKKSA